MWFGVEISIVIIAPFFLCTGVPSILQFPQRRREDVTYLK